LNDDLIRAVDSRVAEVVPLLDPKTPADALIASLHEQVGKLLVESTFEGKSDEEARAICKSEADASAPRWKIDDEKRLQQSLARLHQWKVAHSQK